jgi:hypothetical protein
MKNAYKILIVKLERHHFGHAGVDKIMLTDASGFGYGPETGSCVTGNEHSNVLRIWAALTQVFRLSQQ